VKKLTALLFAIALTGVLMTPTGASSHREAPLISGDPRADNTDVYAFVSPDQPGTVTIIANYIPLEEPAGGPNFNEFDPQVRYEIHVDNDGDGSDDVTYRFRFTTKQQSGQNGVSSSSWTSSSYECYKVEAARPGDAQQIPAAKAVLHKEIRRDPGNLQNFRDQIGHSFLFEVTGKGAFSTSIYGSDIYSDDSPLAVVAVHAGVLTEGVSGVVKVTILGPQDRLGASARNGVTSTSWGAISGSYKVELADKSTP